MQAPDSTSFEELEAMWKEAKQREAALKETTASNSKKADDSDAAKVRDVAAKHVQAALDELPSPLTHKAMIFEILGSFFEWHKNQGLEAQTDEERAAWLMDAGKLQSMANIMSTICMNDNDFMVIGN